MLLKGIRLVLRFPYGVYSMRLFFPEPLRIPVNCTFTITAPSFKCRLTFLPMQDLALLALKFSRWSHHSYSWSAILFQHCWHMGSFSPFISMYSLMFSFLQSSFHGFLQCSMLSCLQGCLFWCLSLLRQLQKRLVRAGEGWVKVKLDLFVVKRRGGLSSWWL